MTVLVLGVFLCRAWCWPQRLRQELQQVAGIVAYQTGVMSAYLLAGYLAEYALCAALVLWWLAFGGNGLLLLRFVRVQVADGLRSESFIQLWYLMFVGVAVAALSGVRPLLVCAHRCKPSAAVLGGNVAFAFVSGLFVLAGCPRVAVLQRTFLATYASFTFPLGICNMALYHYRLQYITASAVAGQALACLSRLEIGIVVAVVSAVVVGFVTHARSNCRHT